MYEKEFEEAKRVAYEAGQFLRKHYNIHIDSSEGKDIKLSADKESEEMIFKGLRPFGYSLLSEEKGLEETGTEIRWIIDPLDGTMNYSKGMDDLSCVSISLWKKDEPLFGIVYRFRVDEMFSGMIGKGAWINDYPIKPSRITKVSDSIIATGFPVKRTYDTNSLTSFIEKVQRFKKVRMLGAAAIMTTYVACGKVDAYMEEDIMLWDVAAGAAIIKAAGGIAEIEIKEDNKCICKCFANSNLMESYYAEGL